jgi:beta-glucosidase
MKLLGEPAPTLTMDGLRFRDLNKNGKLDAYEDIRADLEKRVEDLTKQMNLEEKAGLMFITMIGMVLSVKCHRSKNRFLSCSRATPQ